MDLVSAALDGDRLALARLLTQAENDTVLGREGLKRLFPYAGKAHLIGITGGPGTGKSTLVNQIAKYYRKPGVAGGQEARQANRVAILAVDPTSPFTGGAILGDRVRMRDLAGDAGVFIRSMATRGSLGGLAHTTAALVQIFDASGFDVVLIETVGAGQAEVDIARLAHTTLVVEAPGLGDDIQAIKAGILEIADILVINKADHPGVDAAERALRSMLQLAHPLPHVFQHHHAKYDLQYSPSSPPQADGEEAMNQLVDWETPIQRTIAIEGDGIPELIEQIERHAVYLRQSGEWQRRDAARLRSTLDDLIRESLMDKWRSSITDEKFEQILCQLVERNLSPWEAADLMLNGGVK